MTIRTTTPSFTIVQFHSRKECSHGAVVRALPPGLVGNFPRGHCEQEWYKTKPRLMIHEWLYNLLSSHSWIDKYIVRMGSGSMGHSSSTIPLGVGNILLS
jgi:hypothetical protein